MRLHDCAQFTCILVLCLCTLPFQYTCIIYYICAHFKFYTSSEKYFLHLYLYDLYITGEYYLIYIIHSGNMEKFVTNSGKPGLLYDGFQYRIHKETKSSRTWRCTKKECKATCTITDLSDLVLDCHSSITILSQMRDRFKDIKFVKSANVRPRWTERKTKQDYYDKLRSRTQHIFCQVMLNQSEKPYLVNGRGTVTKISLD